MSAFRSHYFLVAAASLVMLLSACEAAYQLPGANPSATSVPPPAVTTEATSTPLSVQPGAEDKTGSVPPRDDPTPSFPAPIVSLTPIPAGEQVQIGDWIYQSDGVQLLPIHRVDETVDTGQQKMGLAARRIAARFTGADLADTTLRGLKPVQWPGQSLGCDEKAPAESNGGVPGFLATVEVQGRILQVHMDAQGKGMVCGGPVSPPSR